MLSLASTRADRRGTIQRCSCVFRCRGTEPRRAHPRSNRLGVSPATSSGALFGGSLAARKVERGVDQRNMRERLRKVPELASEPRIVFLRQEADIVAQRHEPLEQLPRLGDASLQDEIVGEPEAAGEKRPFARRQPVNHLSGVVAQYEPVDDEAPLNRLEGARDPRVRRR